MIVATACATLISSRAGSGCITELAPEISQLQNVQKINFRGNEFRELPPAFFQRAKLPSIDFGHN